MAGHETRMLLLGAVALFEPVNGYQIRRELLSWQVDRWAHTNPGSIYHGLGTLTKQGHLVRHDLVDAGREVAVYELSAAGREELARLVTGALEAVDPVDRAAFTAAFSLLPLLPRATAVESLTVRQAALEETIARLSETDPDLAPPHVDRTMAMWRELAVAELTWLGTTLADLRSGSLRYQPGDDWGGWQPRADDPGWQMNADRERYRALLGR